MEALILLAYGNAVGELLVFARFASLGILGRYKWFALWIAFSAVREFAILIATSSHLKTADYWNLWQTTEPIALGLEVLVAFEVFDLIASSLLGLGSLGEKVLTVAVSIGIVISMALTLADWRGFSPWMFQIKRTVTLILAIALMCISWAFLWIARPLRRNLVYHCRILTVYLSSVAAGYFLLNMGVRRNLGSILFLSVCLVCLLLWTILISRGGEEVLKVGFDNGGPPFQLKRRGSEDRFLCFENRE